MSVVGDKGGYIRERLLVGFSVIVFFICYCFFFNWWVDFFCFLFFYEIMVWFNILVVDNN